MERAHFNQFYTQEQISLANEIAYRLKDQTSLKQFLKYTKEVPHDYIRQSLQKACDAPDHLIAVSRAAIFVGKINDYTRLHGDGTRS
ncbi:hypothetical protein [Mucilaginibacter sp. dw_454]|uniref:hypothetical protein n=1 Tax=Mucilaginibacter sp. dw_454 TaxID=2720079 RepID=UPI001BD5CAB2|nr:hypothetical protein [Mucilaginibacter sp. dw_454]